MLRIETFRENRKNGFAPPSVPTRALRMLIVPGLHDSGPGHWQTRWQQGLQTHLQAHLQDIAPAGWQGSAAAELSARSHLRTHLRVRRHNRAPIALLARRSQRWDEVGRVEQSRWDEADIGRWSQQVSEALQQSELPTVIVAHSFGCLATLRAKAPDHLLGALLVAPANPQRFGIAAELAHARPAFATRLIASRNDPWMGFDDARHWAARWGSALVDAGALGHINADSGLGDWWFGQQQLQQLLTDIGAPAE